MGYDLPVSAFASNFGARAKHLWVSLENVANARFEPKFAASFAISEYINFDRMLSLIQKGNLFKRALFILCVALWFRQPFSMHT